MEVKLYSSDFRVENIFPTSQSNLKMNFRLFLIATVAAIFVASCGKEYIISYPRGFLGRNKVIH